MIPGPGSIRWAYGHHPGMIRTIRRRVMASGSGALERRECEAEECLARTRDHKPYCLKHIYLMPQVTKILGEL